MNAFVSIFTNINEHFAISCWRSECVRIDFYTHSRARCNMLLKVRMRLYRFLHALTYIWRLLFEGIDVFVSIVARMRKHCSIYCWRSECICIDVYTPSRAHYNLFLKVSTRLYWFLHAFASTLRWLFEGLTASVSMFTRTHAHFTITV